MNTRYQQTTPSDSRHADNGRESPTSITVQGQYSGPLHKCQDNNSGVNDDHMELTTALYTLMVVATLAEDHVHQIPLHHR